MRLGGLGGGKVVRTDDDAFADLDHVTASDRPGEAAPGQSVLIATNCCNRREHAWIHAGQRHRFRSCGPAVVHSLARPPPTLLAEPHIESDIRCENRRDLCGSPSKVGWGGVAGWVGWRAGGGWGCGLVEGGGADEYVGVELRGGCLVRRRPGRDNAGRS